MKNKRMCIILEERNGYSTITYRFRFYDKHLNWLWETKVLYNKVIQHYYNLLIDFPEMLTLSNYQLMRQLEVMTIGTKEMKQKGQKASYPFCDFPVIPLYFRRAAINCAISMVRNFQIQKEMVKTFLVAPVYYKGMYKEWEKDSIMLKVYTGKRWVWNCYHFKGRNLPERAQILSPLIYTEEKQTYLHVPIKKVVEDIRSIKERMKVEKCILALSFPGNNSIAVGAVMTREGFLKRAQFFLGGLELKARKKTLKRKLEKLKKQCQLETKKKERYRKRIENINKYYAHLVSRRIVEYCISQEIKIIVVPNYQHGIDFSKKRYLNTDCFEWIGRKIIQYLKYKAFLNGILVSAVPTVHISDCCSVCGAKIKRYNEGHTPGAGYWGGQLFLCPNGHQGNSGLNTARNVGKRFISYYKN